MIKDLKELRERARERAMWGKLIPGRESNNHRGEALREECDWHVSGISRCPLKLKHGEQGGKQEE